MFADKTLSAFKGLAGLVAGFGLLSSAVFAQTVPTVQVVEGEALSITDSYSSDATHTDLWTVGTHPEIEALAYSLKYDHTLIYQYIRDNIETLPMFGLKKGAMGALIDKKGTALDQASLMVELLKVSDAKANRGFAPKYRFIRANINRSDMTDLFGLSDQKDVCRLHKAGGFAFGMVNGGTTSNNCDALASGTYDSVNLLHVVVEAKVSSLTVAFDPSLKKQIHHSGVDLGAYMSFDQNALNSAANYTTGTTSGGISYISGDVQSAVEAELQDRAESLVTKLKGDADYAKSTVDIVGGVEIAESKDQAAIPSTFPTTASLPHYASALDAFGSVPDTYRTKVSITHNNSSTVAYLDDLYGRRTWFRKNSSNVEFVVGRRVVWSTAYLDGNDIHVKVTHPLNSANSASNLSAAFNPPFTNGVGTTAALIIGTGDTGLGLVGRYLDDKYQEHAEDTNKVLAEESSVAKAQLSVGANFLAQQSGLRMLTDGVTDSRTTLRAVIGMVAGKEGADGTAFLDMRTQMAVTAPGGNAASRAAAFETYTAALSALEGSVVDQAANVSDAANASAAGVGLITAALKNGGKLYDVPVGQMANVKADLTGYSATELERLETGQWRKYNETHRLLLPSNGDIAVGGFTGAGYIVVDDASGSQGHLLHDSTYARNESIKGSYSRGMDPADWLDISEQHVRSLVGRDSEIMPSLAGPRSSITDITAGSGGFPYALPFTRSYSKGWAHNYNVRAFFGANGMASLGSRAPAEAAYSIAAIKSAYEYVKSCSESTCVLRKAALSAAVMNWAQGKMRDNAFTVRQGHTSTVYIKLADNKYRGPAGSHVSTVSVSGAGLSTKVTITNIDGFVQNFSHVNEDNVGVGRAFEIRKWSWPQGVDVTFSYNTPADANSQIVISNNLGRQLTIKKKFEGRQLTIVDEAGNGRVFFENNNMQVTTDGTSGDIYATYKYGPGGIEESTVRGITTSYSYDAMHRVIKRTNAARGTFNIYSNSWRSETVDPSGASSVSISDPYGRFAESTDALGNVSRQEFDRLGRSVKTVLPEYAAGKQNTIEYSYDRYHHKTSEVITSALGSKIIGYSYHGEGQYRKLYKVTAPDSSVTEYHYHTSGNGKGLLKSQLLPSVSIMEGASVSSKRPTTEYTYTAIGLPETMTSPDGTVTKYTYTNGLPTKVVVDETNRKIQTNYTYTPRGDVATVTDHRNNVTSFTYNDFRRQKTVTAPGGAFAEYIYDAGVRLKEMKQKTTAAGALLTVSREYDAAGRVTAVVDHKGNRNEVIYDDEGRIIRVIAPNGVTVERELDALGRSVKVVSAKGTTGAITETTGYTKDGLVAWVENGRDTKTSYEYDAWRRLKKTAYFAGTGDEQITEYDVMDRPTKMITRGGDVVTLTYNKLGWVTSQAISGGANYDYRYDFLGRQKEVRRRASGSDHKVIYDYDSLGRVTKELDTSTGMSMEYAFNDAAGTYDLKYHGGMMVRYATDALGRVTSIKENGTTDIASYQYDLASRVEKITFGNGAVQDYSYDADTGWLNELTLDANGNGSTADAGDVSFTYERDNLSRILSEAISNPDYLFNPPFAEGQTDYTANAVDRYTKVGAKSTTYNTAGNLTKYGDMTVDGDFTYIYDAENRLTEAKKRIGGQTLTVGTYKYDALGRRSEKDAGGTKRRFLWGGWINYGEYTDGNIAKRLFVYGPGIDEPIVIKEDDGTKRYVHRDGKSNVVAVTLASGAVEHSFSMDAFGNGTDAAVSPYKFTSRRLDGETGLYYYRNRYYHAELGRFMSEDPIGYGDGLNMYAYAHNDPVNFRDPFGLSSDVTEIGVTGQRPAKPQPIDRGMWDGLTRFSDEHDQFQDARARHLDMIEEIVVKGYRTGTVSESFEKQLQGILALFKSLLVYNRQIALGEASAAFVRACATETKGSDTRFTAHAETVAAIVGYQATWGRYSSSTGETGRYISHTALLGAGIAYERTTYGTMSGTPSQSIAGFSVTGSAAWGLHGFGIPVGAILGGAATLGLDKGYEYGYGTGAGLTGGVTYTTLYPDPGTRHLCEIIK